MVFATASKSESGHRIGYLTQINVKLMFMEGTSQSLRFLLEVPKKPTPGCKLPNKGALVSKPLTVQTWGTISASPSEPL